MSNPLFRFLLLICGLSPICAYSQSGSFQVVADSQTREGIAFVNIGIFNTAKGTVSNEFGQFQLSDIQADQIVSLSSIGYEDLQLKGAELKAMDTLFLNPVSYTIETIEINAKKLGPEEMYGVKNKTRGLSIGFGSRQLGTEVGAIIPIDSKTFLKSAHFILNHAKGDSLLFRVNIYDYSEGKRGEKLLLENVLIRDKQRKGEYTVDLSPYQLYVDQDLLLSLEWLQDDDDRGNTDITFDTKKSKKGKGAWIKKSSIGTFERVPYINRKLKPCFYLMGKPVLD